MNRILITADWHLDKGNRLDDFAKSITSMVDYAIRNEVRRFFILGDLYRDWHASPMEKDFVHRVLLKLSRHKIDVFIILGNHDVDDKNFQHGLTSTQEIETLKVQGVRVISTPEIISIANKNILALPHLSRRFLESERKRCGKDVTYIDLIRKYLANSPSLVLGHLLIADAVKGGSDIGMESPRAVRLSDLSEVLNVPAFFGDIHLPQVLRETPILAYVGSPDRINFGEAGDSKRFLVYDLDCGAVESISIVNRNFLDIKVDLDSSNIVMKGCIDGSVPLDDAPPMDALRAFFSAVAKDASGSVVKLTVSGHKDRIDKLVKHEVAAYVKNLNPYMIKAITFVVTDDTVVRDTTYSTIPTDEQAFTYWVDSRGYDARTRDRILTAGMRLIKER